MSRQKLKIKQNIQKTVRFCFVVEGHTEEDYLKTVLGVNGLNVIYNPSSTDPYSLIKKGVRLWESERGFDKIFVLFDKDQLQAHSPIVSKIQFLVNGTDNDVIPVCTSPLFEYILLLHFQPNHHPQDIKDPKHALKEFGHDNHKEEPDRSKLMGHLKHESERVEKMLNSLKKRDASVDLQFTNNTPLNDRLNPKNSPNSNFYQVLDELDAQGLLSFPLQSNA